MSPRCFSKRALILGAFLVPAVLPAFGQPVTPTIAYPNAAQRTNIKLNPTIFWTAYDRPGGAFASDIQRSFEIQIATSSSFSPDTIVYRTDSGPGDPPDCTATIRPRCLGAGMAHFVTTDGSYPGLFQNALAGADRLAEGTDYYVRLRVQSSQDRAWSSWSSTVAFQTVRYDGSTFVVSTVGQDTASCGIAPGPDCRTLRYALTNRVVDNHGDTVMIRAGTYDIPPVSAGGGIDFHSNNFPRRVRIMGEAPTTRPVLRMDRYINSEEVKWMNMQRARDLILENLILEGPTACCATQGSHNSYVISMDGRDQNRNERVSFINVETRRNVIVRQNNYNLSQGEIDVLWWNYHQSGSPPYNFGPWSNRNDNLNFKLTSTRASTYLTFKGFDSRDVDDHIELPGEFNADTGLSHTFRHILIEDSQFYRANIHPFRPQGAVENFTMRRTAWGDGAEHQPAFSTAESSLRNAVFENNTIVKGLRITNDNGDGVESGTIGYLVARNNIFTRVDVGNSGSVFEVVDLSDEKKCFGRCSGGTRDGLACGWCDREVLIDCQNDGPCSTKCNVCPGGTCEDTCDVLGPTDRISLDYNIYFAPGDTFDLVSWDGDGSSCTTNRNGFLGGLANCYSRRGSSSSGNWDAWLALGYDANSPFRTYNGGLNREPPDPRLTYVPNNDGSLGYADLHLQPGSPAINAGDPETWVPVGGGGSRVDIGALEFDQAPIVTAIDPPAGEVCVSDAQASVTFEIQDPQAGDSIDPATLEVQVDGTLVSPSITGSGNKITVTVGIPGGAQAARTVTVDVSVADNAVPPNYSQSSFSFDVQPGPPTGVDVNPS